ncbi:hypothetical protein NEOKW01_1433 [Nematocida sp. AWRm80]|nr:hypothetical protein NEOKW01_1433 [Nematocida sp. AWRm80]
MEKEEMIVQNEMQAQLAPYEAEAIQPEVVNQHPKEDAQELPLVEASQESFIQQENNQSYSSAYLNSNDETQAEDLYEETQANGNIYSAVDETPYFNGISTNGLPIRRTSEEELRQTVQMAKIVIEKSNKSAEELNDVDLISPRHMESLTWVQRQILIMEIEISKQKKSAEMQWKPTIKDGISREFAYIPSAIATSKPIEPASKKKKFSFLRLFLCSGFSRSSSSSSKSAKSKKRSPSKRKSNNK